MLKYYLISLEAIKVSKFNAKPFKLESCSSLPATCSSVLERFENKGIVFIFCGRLSLLPPTPL